MEALRSSKAGGRVESSARARKILSRNTRAGERSRSQPRRLNGGHDWDALSVIVLADMFSLV